MRHAMGRAGSVLLAAALASALAFLGGQAAGDDGPAPLGPGLVTVHVRVEHSRFEPDHVAVRPGTTVRFMVTNDDPIDHELIVGPQDVHDRHERGTEAHHPPVPGEVSVPAGTTATTVYAFDDAGPVLYACHLPGHFAYGMRGTVDVVASDE